MVIGRSRRSCLAVLARSLSPRLGSVAGAIIRTLVGGVGLAGATVAGGALLLAPAEAFACSVCWIADDPLGNGLFWSTLFLAGAPFMLGGGMIGLVLYLQRRQARSQSPTREAAQPYLATSLHPRMRGEPIRSLRDRLVQTAREERN